LAKALPDADRLMIDTPSPLAAALQRLGSAIDLLDAAAARRLAAEKGEAARLMELELMRGDRARLAELLDQAMARNQALEAAQDEAERRIEQAMALVGEALNSAGCAKSDG
jgi:hypothetical protein